MKKVLSFLLILLTLLSLYHGQITFSATKDALMLWFEKLVPSMFVSMVLARILYQKQILHHIRIPFLSRILRIDDACMPLVLCSMILGFPSGSLFIDEACERKELHMEGALRLLYTCSFATPGFVIMSCGLVFYHSIALGCWLFLAQVISGLLLLLMTRSTPVQALSLTHPNRKDNVFADAILQTGKALYLIGGYLMLFMSICSILMPYIPEELQLPVRILAEFSSGTAYISALPYHENIRMLLTCFLLSFAGFCVHMQVHSMVSYCPVSYRKYLGFRILQGVLSMLIFYIFLKTSLV